ncbi:MAG: hypothetical protein QXX99_06395, partial [Candidatus Bathyarchaeia archaeon]
LFFLYTAMAETYNFLYGFCGLLNLGLQMFVGFGGYVMAILTSNLVFLRGSPYLLAEQYQPF